MCVCVCVCAFSVRGRWWQGWPAQAVFVHVSAFFLWAGGGGKGAPRRAVCARAFAFFLCFCGRVAVASGRPYARLLVFPRARVPIGARGLSTEAPSALIILFRIIILSQRIPPSLAADRFPRFSRSLRRARKRGWTTSCTRPLYDRIWGKGVPWDKRLLWGR